MTFNAALATGEEFDVVVISSKKRAAIARTLKRLNNELRNDRFLLSLADKVALYDFYPCMADAWMQHRYSIRQDDRTSRLTLTFVPPK